MRGIFATLAVSFLSLCVLGAAAAKDDATLAPSTVKVVLSSGHGSGVHIGGGFVVTAAHVVADQKLVVVLTEAGDEQRAEVVLLDTLDDLAIVRIKSFAKLAASTIACRAPAVGEAISVRGNPLGLEFVSAWGRVSGLPRALAHWRSVMIVNMAILPGNSGGPVFDADDRILGIAVGLIVLGGAPTTYATVVPGPTLCRLRDILTTTV